MATRKNKSINDLVEQANRIRNNYNVRYDNPRLYNAYSNEMQKKLKSYGNIGDAMIAVSDVTDNGFSPGNTAQRLYNMAQRGNADARRMLYGNQIQTRSNNKNVLSTAQGGQG